MSLSDSAIQLLHRHPGRYRKLHVRRGMDGKSDGERPADVVSIAKAYRIRDGAMPDNALDYRYGFTIGRLWLERLISEAQFHAAERYLTCVVLNARLHGIPSPHPRATNLLMAGAGLSCEKEPDEAWVAEQLGKFRNCRAALLKCGGELGLGSAVNRITYGVVVENWPIKSLQREDIQNLRCGLNALDRVLS